MRVVLLVIFFGFFGTVKTQEIPQCPQISLSLQKCFFLALHYNVDIAESKCLPKIAETEMLKTKSPYDVYLRAGYHYGRVDSRLLQEKQGSFDLEVAKRFLTGTQVSLGYSLQYLRSSDLKYTRELNRFISSSFDSQWFDEDTDLKKLWSSGIRLQVSQPLLRNFGIAANENLKNAAEKSQKMADYEVKRQINYILAQTEIAYWTWVFYEKNRKIWKRSIEQAKKYKEFLQKKIAKVDTGLPSDIHAINVNIYERECCLIEATKKAHIAKDRLRRLIFPFHPKQKGKLGWEKKVVPTEKAFQDFFQMEKIQVSYTRAIKNRPEIYQVLMKKAQVGYLVKHYKNELLPTLNVIGDVTFLGEEKGTGKSFSKGFSGDHYRWRLGVEFEYPLGNIGAKSQLLKKKIEMEKIELELKKLKYQIYLQIQEALHELKAAKEKCKKMEWSVDEAKRRLKEIEKRFRNPLPGDFNLVFFLDDAESKRTKVYIQRIQALLEYKLARIKIKFIEARYLNLGGVAEGK